MFCRLQKDPFYDFELEEEEKKLEEDKKKQQARQSKYFSSEL
jgi:hypothetical protein